MCVFNGLGVVQDRIPTSRLQTKGQPCNELDPASLLKERVLGPWYCRRPAAGVARGHVYL